MNRTAILRLAALLALFVAVPSNAMQEAMKQPDSHSGMHNMASQAAPAEDSRPLVKLTPETIGLLRADMRQMMSSYATIFGLLADAKYQEAAKAIEENLGMTAMGTHPGMMKASQELPENVRMLGMGMHKSASELAKTLKSNNPKPAAIFEGMQQISAGCTACHMAYRVR